MTVEQMEELSRSLWNRGIVWDVRAAFCELVTEVKRLRLALQTIADADVFTARDADGLLGMLQCVRERANTALLSG